MNIFSTTNTQEECSSKYDLQTHIHLFHNGVIEEADIPKGLSCPDCLQDFFYRIVCHNIIYLIIFIGTANKGEFRNIHTQSIVLIGKIIFRYQGWQSESGIRNPPVFHKSSGFRNPQFQCRIRILIFSQQIVFYEYCLGLPEELF